MILSPAEQSIIDEELALYARVKEACEEAPFRDRANAHLRARLMALREEMNEAIPTDLAAIHNQVHELRSIAERRLASPLPDRRVPYFAHMQIETEHGLRDILLGNSSFIDAHSGVTLVDWKSAPIARVFFQGREGDDFMARLPDRTIEGVLCKRRILVFDEGELLQITGDGFALRRARHAPWCRDERGDTPQLAGGEGGDPIRRLLGTGQSGRENPVLASLLDEAQYDAVTRDPSKPVLILGSAGCGKTTVALHRLAYLHSVKGKADRAPAAQREMLAIVPEPGLVRLTRSLLAELALDEVPVVTADDWFVEQGMSLFPELPARRAVATPAVVVRMKRHPAMASVLPMIADRAGLLSARRMDRKLGGGEIEALYRSSKERVPLARLEDAVRCYDGNDRNAMETLFEEERKRFERVDEDRAFLLSDPEVIRTIIERGAGDFGDKAGKQLLMHSRIQLSRTTEESHPHLPASRKRTADGRPIDERTPNEDADSIDAEDFPLMLALHQLKTGSVRSRHGRLARVRHLVIDEAQELSHVELQVLGRALAPGGTVIIAGDPAQQIDESTRFSDWSKVIEALGVESAEPSILETSYRCTEAIADFGHRVLGEMAPVSRPRGSKKGADVGRSQFRNEMHATARLSDALRDLMKREPQAQVAILLRDMERARRLHASLPPDLPSRLVEAGEFRFEPGIEVATVRQVKGLEFDYVIVPDVSAQTYPDDSLSRRTLHVAATRAIHQLWLIATGTPSPLLHGD